MAEFIKFGREILEGEHLDIVREIGRQIGVRAPASRNKNQVIDEIQKIQAGTLEPVPKNKRGAPQKIIVDVSKYYVKNKSDDYSDVVVNDTLIFSDGTEEDDSHVVEGYLEHNNFGYGFIRTKIGANSPSDAFVSLQNIKKFNLHNGDKVKGVAKIVKEGDSAALQNVIAINDFSPKLFFNRKEFDDLTPCYPTEKLRLENDENKDDLALRIIDLFVPLGKGQRGLIVAPPKTGKTTILKMIAKAIEHNYPGVKLIIMLIDERPEEVTDIQRSVGNSEVVFSTFDQSAEHHVRTAETVIRYAKRIVEVGKDVVILMDSITRLTRAYNNTVESSGKTLSGGLDPSAMRGPKRFFGSARNIENGGSLTILSTALVDTGSRMDDVIFEEFKGTGNMEIHLSRELSERRIFPAIDLMKSGTRKEELLLNENELSTARKIRSMLHGADSTDKLLDMLKKTKNNRDLSLKIDEWLKVYNSRK